MNDWRGTGDAYAASYASLCAGTNDALIRSLGPGQGRRIVDVGSGTGVLVGRLRDAGWAVTGCEPEPTMREVAVQQQPDVSFLDGGLPELPFDDASFDAVTANFVLNHVDDPRMSAKELARVASTAAPLAATIWTVSPSAFWKHVYERANMAPAGERLPPDRDFERTADGFGRMLAQCGWGDVIVEELTWTWRATPQQLWVSVEGGVASAGTMFQSLNDAQKHRFRAAFDEVVTTRAEGRTLAFEYTAALALGTAM